MSSTAFFGLLIIDFAVIAGLLIWTIRVHKKYAREMNRRG